MKHTLIAVLILCAVCSYAGDGWMTNFEEAKAVAAKEKKPMLVDFTGSDWCGYCIRLNKSVLSQEAFKTYAKDKFVLVELDFPRRKKISQELRSQNQALAKKYSVRGYPTILLMDAEGLPFAKTGYRPGDVAAYNKHLDVLLAGKVKFDAAMKEAEGVEGADKAAKLVEALKQINPVLLPHYSKITEQIKTLDPEDKTGFVKEQETKAALQKLGATVVGFARKKDAESGTKAIKDFFTKHKPEGDTKQQALFYNVYFLPFPPKSHDDCDAADKLMDDVIAVNPKSRVAQQCTMIKKRIEGLRAKLPKETDSTKAPETDPNVKPETE